MPPRRSHLLFEQILPNAADGDLPGLRALPVASVDPNPDQPRKAPLRGIEDLAASIQAYGLLQPIVVRRKGDDRYTCIAGHRRLAAYAWLLDHDQERARWIEIPAIERDAHTDDLLVLALLENLSREELSEAEIITGLRLLHDLRGWSQREIARRLGVSSGWIPK